MAGLDNKISNIIGTKLPQWLLDQVQTRAILGAKDSRDNNNLLFLANKSCWVRLVSSVNLDNQNDINYFNRIVGGITKADDLAKQFVLFGGTSKYLDKNSYKLRSGIADDGAYGILGTDEVQKYGYRPMPGIINASVETQGKLGSVRSAVINFKCWDKSQLDIIDALYFKLGFTMFLEWGSTVYYKSKDPSKVQSSELLSIDPFQAGLNKEQIYIQISKNCRASEGNYDAMLGVVTNFTFSFNQEGGYDCQLRLMALGSLADSIKINNVGTLPALVKEEIRELNNTLIKIEQDKLAKEEQERLKALKEQEALENANKVSILRELNNLINKKDKDPDFSDLGKIIQAAGYAGSKTTNVNDYDFLYDIGGTRGKSLLFPTFGAVIPTDTINELIQSITLDTSYLFEKFDNFFKKSVLTQPQQQIPGPQGTQTIPGTAIPNFQGQIQTAQQNFSKLETLMFFNRFSPDNKEQIRVDINYLGANAKTYYASIRAEFGRSNPQYKKEILNQQLVYESAINKLRESSNIEFTDVSFSARSVNESSDIKVFGKVDSNINTTTITGIPFYPVIALSTTVKVEVPGTVLVDKPTTQRTITVNEQGTVIIPVTIDIIITDTDLIYDIIRGSKSPDYLRTQASLTAQNQTQTTTKEDEAAAKAALETQINEALKSQSYLELSLRAIQLHALNRAIKKRGVDIQKLVYTLKMTDPKEITFLKQVFSNGIFTDFIDDLILQNNVSDPTLTNLVGVIKNAFDYGDGLQSKNGASLKRLERLKIQSKYGFATSLMGDYAPIEKLSPCDFTNLLRAFVVPYQISQEIVKGVETNHPVYIPFGLLLMLLNHSCTMYDSEKPEKDQTPLVYIDFNTEHNYFLSNTKQLSTNPWVTLIPFEGAFADYKTLFESNVLDGNNIKPPTGSVIPLFNPEKEDALSSQLPRIKYDSSGNNIYRGKMMNILLNIDYLIKVVRDFSYRDGTNSIYLKEFIEQILTDVNKYLGNINVLRLSYNDKANTFQIVDDQFIPGRGEEDQLSPKDVKTTNTILNRSNTTEIPLLGKYSIAKSLEIKSDMSNKLASMIAISSNAEYKDKAAVSQNGDSYGYINTSYKDRYIVNKLGAPTGSSINIDSIINSATQFNQTVSDFYSKINPVETSVSHATNYFIDKMTKIKNDEYPTRAAAMIPVSINFTTDGVSGFLIGQGFTVSEELLPYTYTNRVVPGAKGLQQDHINKVGFVVVGVSHTLESNQWNTAIRANMIFLKDATEFSGSVIKQTAVDRPFTRNPNNAVSDFDDRLNVNDFTNYPVASTSYSNIKYGSGYLGNPAGDKINPELLKEINTAASNAGVVVTITTAVSGHKSLTSTGTTSRHTTGNAVDISIVNGVAVSNKQKIQTQVDKFVAQLKSLGYAVNSESGNPKAVLTYGFANHDDHIHISNTSV